MTALPQWTVNTQPTVMPDTRAYNPAAWTFHTTMNPGETMEEWIGRDWALRCRSEGHIRGIPRNTGIDGNGVRKSINARFAKTGHPHQITEDNIKSALSCGASLDCVQIMSLIGQNHEVTRRGLRRLELAGDVSVIRCGPSSKKVFTLVLHASEISPTVGVGGVSAPHGATDAQTRRAGRKTGGAV